TPPRPAANLPPLPPSTRPNPSNRWRLHQQSAHRKPAPCPPGSTHHPARAAAELRVIPRSAALAPQVSWARTIDQIESHTPLELRCRPGGPGWPWLRTAGAPPPPAAELGSSPTQVGSLCL